jgi:hypothetical protein
LECAALGARLGRTARPDAGGGVGLAAAGRGVECPACSRICCWCQARDEWECNPLPAADKFGTPRYENGSTAAPHARCQPGWPPAPFGLGHRSGQREPAQGGEGGSVGVPPWPSGLGRCCSLALAAEGGGVKGFDRGRNLSEKILEVESICARSLWPFEVGGYMKGVN